MTIKTAGTVLRMRLSFVIKAIEACATRSDIEGLFIDFARLGQDLQLKWLSKRTYAAGNCSDCFGDEAKPTRVF